MKAKAPKKDRREQNRINQQSFRERKRKEFEDLRAQLDSMKASQLQTSDERPLDTSVGPERPEHFTLPQAPFGAAQFGTVAGSETDRKTLTLDSPPDDGTMDPSLLALSSSTNFGLPPAPYQLDIPETNDCGAPLSGPLSTFGDPEYTYVPHYDPGSDGMPSATHNMPLSAPCVQNTSSPADPLTSITADYMNAQLLAFKSAEWYARAAEVGIKIATTRENAWLDKSTLWPQWSLGDAGRSSLPSVTERTAGLDYMSADTSDTSIPPPPMDFSKPWMLRQDWQQVPPDLRDAVA